MIPDFKNKNLWQEFEQQKKVVKLDARKLLTVIPSKNSDDPNSLCMPMKDVEEYNKKIADFSHLLTSLEKDIKYIEDSEEFINDPKNQLNFLKEQIKNIEKVGKCLNSYISDNPLHQDDGGSEIFFECYKDFKKDLDVLSKDIKKIEEKDLNPSSSPAKMSDLEPHTYGQENLDLENIQENKNHPSQAPKFPELPSLILPKILSNTRVNSTNKQIERVNILLDSLKEVLDWRYGNLLKSNQVDNRSLKKVAELHQSIQYFQSYINGMDKGAIKRTYMDECKDISKQIQKVFTNNLKPEEKSHTKEFFSKTIKELSRLHSKFKSL